MELLQDHKIYNLVYRYHHSYTIDGGTAVTGTSPGNPFDMVSTLSAGAHL
jgi:hypothetical protein